MIFRSPDSDVEIPNVPLHELVLRDAQQWADKPALIDGATGATVTYGDLAQQVERAAAGLARRGLQQGDVVGLVSPNTPPFAVAVFAVMALGGIVQPLNPLLTTTELARMLHDAGTKYLITVPAAVPRVLDAAGRSGIETFVLGEAAGATPFASLMQDSGPPPTVSIDPADDPALVFYSSGTTGLPKGVMLTHRNVAAILTIVQRAAPIVHEDRLIAVIPFFHTFGMISILCWGLAYGTTVVTMPRFEFEPFLRLIQEHRVTRTHVAPPVVNALAKHPAVEGYDLSSLRVVLCGGAPLGAETARQCADRIGCTLKQAYALTEAQPIHLSPPDGGKFGSVGRCVVNTEVKIVDIETGAEFGPNQPGEIWVRGPQVMKGYLHNPEATAQAITPDGWLRTGDIGYADTEGYFYIVDRLKELIKYKGYQVAPAELEAVLLSHPAVADAAVIGIPDEDAGEVPKAFIVRRAAADAEQIMAYVADRVAPYKKVRQVAFVNEIPKSPSGKILRRMLKEREREAIAGSD